MLKVKNIISKRSGNKVVNQYILENDTKIIFQSYDSTIAVFDRDNNVLTLGLKWDYGTTTSKYLYQFMYDIVRFESYGDLNKSINEMYEKSNKRGFIKQLIKNDCIKYDEKMR